MSRRRVLPPDDDDDELPEDRPLDEDELEDEELVEYLVDVLDCF
jgi:hypothetical protein